MSNAIVQINLCISFRLNSIDIQILVTDLSINIGLRITVLTTASIPK